MTVELSNVRSVLFLPASNPRAIAKARGADADLVILDLEDAVKSGDKEAARAAAVEAATTAWPMPVAIRINGIGTDWHASDVRAVAGSEADYVVIPRAEVAAFVMNDAEDTGKPVLSMIETAAGVLAASEIARVSAGLIAGTNDLRADLRLPLDADRSALSAALQWIVLAARAAGVLAVDGVFNRLTDDDGFRAEAAAGRALGFDAKSLIHPNQIAPANETFAPSEDETRRAQALIEAFGGGAERLDDEMVERMHVDAARRVLARART